MISNKKVFNLENYVSELKCEHNALLFLEDGTKLLGKAIGDISNENALGEIVFNTSMTGYQEILSDPAMQDKLVMMTYPLIGNYGLNIEDFESIVSKIGGLIVKEIADYPSNWRSNENLDSYLKTKGILGISGIDTRMITHKIRSKNTMKGYITTDLNSNMDDIINKLNDLTKSNSLINDVSTKNMYRCPGNGHRLVLIDMGMSESVLRELVKRSCDVTVVPYDTTFEQIQRLQPDGILISDGPDNQNIISNRINEIKSFIGRIPIMGISLGHLIIALAAGANITALSNSHRGANTPVKDLRNDRVYITSQNHKYIVDKDSINNTNLQIRQINLNDNSVEALVHDSGLVLSVQYNPTTLMGPSDTGYLFDEFVDIITKWKVNEEGK